MITLPYLRVVSGALLSLALLHFAHSLRVEPSLKDTFNQQDIEYPTSMSSTNHNSLRTPTSLSSPLYSMCVCRTLMESGYHRTLSTKVICRGHSSTSDVLSEGDSSEGSVVIVENITRDLYVDVDQISLLHSMTGEPQLIVSAHMDTEKPAPASSSHVVLIYTKLNNDRLTVELPIHFRYQSPCSDSQYVPITIPPPLILFKLQDNSSEENDIVKTKRLPCDCHSLKLCEWRVMEYKLSDERDDNQDMADVDIKKGGCELSSKELVAMIPCGLQSNIMFVVVLTILVTLAGTIYLCANIIYASSNTATV